MEPVPSRRNTKTGENYLHADALVRLLQNDQFGEPDDSAGGQALDWLIWAVTVDHPPFPEDSFGEVEVALEEGEPRTTVRLRYRWEPQAGLFLCLSDIQKMIDEREKQVIALCRAYRDNRRPNLKPTAFLKETMLRIGEASNSRPDTAREWDGS